MKHAISDVLALLQTTEENYRKQCNMEQIKTIMIYLHLTKATSYHTKLFSFFMCQRNNI